MNSSGPVPLSPNLHGRIGFNILLSIATNLGLRRPRDDGDTVGKIKANPNRVCSTKPNR
jgi:hypothetical protein